MQRRDTTSPDGERSLCSLSNKPEPLYALCPAHGSLGPFPQAGGRQSTVNTYILPSFQGLAGPHSLLIHGPLF